ncbi:MAG: ComEC/Rec2 family competence protein [Pseudomonadota bacterium]
MQKSRGYKEDDDRAVTAQSPQYHVDERFHWAVGATDLLPPAGVPTVPPATQKLPNAGAPEADTSADGRDRKAALRSLRPRLESWFQTAVQTEIQKGSFFVWTPVFLGAGSVVYLRAAPEPQITHLVSGLAFLGVMTALVFAKVQSSLPRLLALAALLMVAGALASKMQTDRIGTQMLGSAISTHITGVIQSIERRANGSVRFTIDLTSTSKPKLKYAPDRIRVVARKVEGLDRWPYANGYWIEGRVRLTPPSSPFRPGGYDFAFANYYAGIGANGFFLGAARVVGPRLEYQQSRADAFKYAIDNARMRLADRITGGDEPSTGLIVASALVTGDRSAIPEEVSVALRRSGLAHILAISGLHMALVSGTILFAVRSGMSLAPAMSSRWPIKKYGATAALASATAYLIMSGGSVATQRAWLMLSIMLIALCLDRSAVTMRNLALAAVFILLIAPNEVMGPSFQMSFAATGALIAVYRSRFGSWMFSFGANETAQPRFISVAAPFIRFALALVTTSIVAGLATSIFAAYHFNRVAPYGLVANFIAVPLVSTLVMPLGVLGVLALPFGIEGPIFGAMGYFINLVVGIATWVVAISPPGAVGILPDRSYLLFVAVLVGLCFLKSSFRYLALLVIVPAIGVWQAKDRPVAMLSVDAKQFALAVDSIMPDGSGARALIFNRNRPNGFTTEQWLPAVAAQDFSSATQLDQDPRDFEDVFDNSMVCGPNTCLANVNYASREGRIVYLNKVSDNNFCATADLIVHAYAPATKTCGSKRSAAVELTAQDLALRGAAMIYVAEKPAGIDETNPFEIIFALGVSERPWNASRVYGRAARNLDEWKPKRQ